MVVLVWGYNLQQQSTKFVFSDAKGYAVHCDFVFFVSLTTQALMLMASTAFSPDYSNFEPGTEEVTALPSL